MNLLGIPIQRRHLLYFFGDLVLLLVSLYLGHFLRLWWTGVPVSLFQILDLTTGATGLFILAHLLTLYVADGYSSTVDFRQPREIIRLFLAISTAFVLQMALYYAIPNWRWGRGIVLLGYLSFLVFAPTYRALVCQLKFRPGRERTLIVGTESAGRRIAKVLKSNSDRVAEFNPVGFVGEPADGLCMPVLGPTRDLVLRVESEAITQVVVAHTSRLPTEVTQGLLELKARGLHIVDMPSLYKQLTGRVPIDDLAETWIIYGPWLTRRDVVLHSALRLADVVSSIVALVLVWPLLILAAVAIKVSSPGPVFYSQERLGLNRQPFMIHKLRTMTTDAERDGAKWSQGASDPRVTHVGRFLRRTRLDELPQFYNVLRGDMSLVGPRPERDHFVKMLEQQIPYYGLRFAVRPGITGWAQVSYRYGASVEDARNKLEYELYAIREMSVALYALIVLKTVQTVLIRPGS